MQARGGAANLHTPLGRSFCSQRFSLCRPGPRCLVLGDGCFACSVDSLASRTVFCYDSSWERRDVLEQSNIQCRNGCCSVTKWCSHLLQEQLLKRNQLLETENGQLLQRNQCLEAELDQLSQLREDYQQLRPLMERAMELVDGRAADLDKLTQVG